MLRLFWFCFVLLRFRRLYGFVEAAALRSIVLRYAGAPIATRHVFLSFLFSLLFIWRICRFFRVFFFFTISAFSLLLLLLLFLTFSALVANPKKTTLHGGQSRSWSAEQGKKRKRKSLAAHPPPPPPRALLVRRKNKKLENHAAHPHV